MIPLVTIMAVLAFFQPGLTQHVLEWDRGGELRPKRKGGASKNRGGAPHVF